MDGSTRFRALYAAFDMFPSSKGAATHIAHAASTLFRIHDGGLLYVMGGAELPAYQREGRVVIRRFSAEVPNFLERTMRFGRALARLVESQGSQLRTCQFRDPWSGVPVLCCPRRRFATVYEVNGLPSIELPYAYPMVARKTLERIQAMERFCWSEADHLITPSVSIRDNLIRMGAPAGKITVVPNGADAPPSAPRPAGAPSRYVIYLGAVQPWQGVHVLLKAVANLADLPLALVICCASSPRRVKHYRKLAGKLGLSSRIMWLDRLDKPALAAWLQHAAVSVAPLTECARNLDQGCCPLKILESMASGTPVVASDIPSIRELVEHGQTGWLVRPDRPDELARGLRLALEYPDRTRARAELARERVLRRFSWEISESRHAAVVRGLRERWLRRHRDATPAASSETG